MNIETPGGALYVLVALAIIVAIATAGRTVAKLLRQPEVIGEIVAGLMTGPIIVAIVGTHRFHEIVPPSVLGALKFIGEVGLIFLLVGITHDLKRATSRRLPARAVSLITTASFTLPLVLGAGLGTWLLFHASHEVRGKAPAPAFILMVAVVMAITAVPVLARILSDRGMTNTYAGRMSMASAIPMDTIGWLVLAAAVSLKSGQVSGFLHAVLVLAVGGGVAIVMRQLLRTDAASRVCANWPKMTALVLAIIALAVAFTIEKQGLTSILGAALVGLAVPVAESAPWEYAVSLLTKVSRYLVPVFFVVTGITALTAAFGAGAWFLTVGVVALGAVGKLAGGYFGAKASGQSEATSRRMGVLMNTRGLTELVVLQVGYSSGILSATLLLAFLVMAVVTTIATGPLLQMIEWRERRNPAVRDPLDDVVETVGAGAAPDLAA